MPFAVRGDEALDAVVNIRLTKAEKVRLAEDADLAALSMSELVRRRFFGRPIIAHADMVMIKDTANVHLHIAVNRVHPVTLKVIKPNRGFDIEAAHRAVARIEDRQGGGARTTVDTRSRRMAAWSGTRGGKTVASRSRPSATWRPGQVKSRLNVSRSRRARR